MGSESLSYVSFSQPKIFKSFPATAARPPASPRALLTHGLSIQNGWGLALSGAQLLISLLNTRLLKLAEDEE